jgi:hypothetical protein
MTNRLDSTPVALLSGSNTAAQSLPKAPGGRMGGLQPESRGTQPAPALDRQRTSSAGEAPRAPLLHRLSSWLGRKLRRPVGTGGELTPAGGHGRNTSGPRARRRSPAPATIPLISIFNSWLGRKRRLPAGKARPHDASRGVGNTLLLPPGSRSSYPPRPRFTHSTMCRATAFKRGH